MLKKFSFVVISAFMVFQFFAPLQLSHAQIAHDDQQQPFVEDQLESDANWADDDS